MGRSTSKLFGLTSIPFSFHYVWESQEVILLSLEGKKNQEIAQLLNLSVLTVKTHKKNAFRYLKNRLQNLVLLVMIIQISKKISCHNVSG